MMDRTTSMARCAAGAFLLTMVGSAAAAPLFRDARPLQGMASPDGPEVLRSRIVRPDFSALPSLQGDAPIAGSRVTLNLFAGLDLEVVIDKADIGYAGGVTYSGHLLDNPGASVVLSRYEEALIGEVREPGVSFFQIRHLGQGIHAAVLADAGALEPCGNGPAQDIPALEMIDVGASPDGAGPIIIDVLTYYTPVARNQAGGANGMIATMNSFVTTTNNSYINSLINQRIRLVRLAETAYTESASMGTDLDRFRSNGEGFMDEVHADRNTFGADLCHLVTGVANGACGIAYTSPLNANFGFGVTARGCGAFTFAHELGHNMGCAHDHNNAGGSSACYAYGWRSTNSQWRTIMSYDPGNGLAYFSNPNITLNLNGTNYTIGISEAAGCPTNTAADNSRRIGELSSFISLYRPTQVGNPPPDSFNLLTPANNAVGLSTGPSFNWQTANLASDYSIVVSPNQDLSNPIFQDNVNSPGSTIPAGTLTHLTRYYWTVTASNLGGQTPSASGTFSFKVRPFGDANGNGTVDFADLNIVLGQFGQSGPGLAGDINADGIVNFADLNIVLGNFGQS